MVKRTQDAGARAGDETRSRILDAAEALFAEAGFDAVSLRMITQRAGVELALANYHFGPKQDLFRAVIMRRATELNAERMSALEALPDDAGLEQLVAAFSGPFLERSLTGGAGWKAYARLIANVANSARWTRAIMSAGFDEVARAFIERVQRLYPDAPAANVYWSFHFLLGAMTMTFAETGRLDVLSAGRCRAADLAAIHAHMIPFLAAGFRALCAPDADR